MHDPFSAHGITIKLLFPGVKGGAIRAFGFEGIISIGKQACRVRIKVIKMEGNRVISRRNKNG
jgi:hypothetical protein